jgi:hypothetical protein
MKKLFKNNYFLPHFCRPSPVPPRAAAPFTCGQVSSSAAMAKA